MEKTFDPHAIEQRIYQRWEDNNQFAPQSSSQQSAQEQPAYCIMIPPPNVTGSLHMGHAFQDTIMDALIRYHRMKGDKTLWQPGTDHAGIATQMVVERQLNAEGKTRHDIGREAFTDRIWDWKEESGGTITKQLRRMGASVDWSRERFTMDDGLSEAVQEVFVKLHDDGLIYRGKRLVNWDPVLETAVSDLEVVSEEEQGHMWHFRYPLADGSGHIVVATTRPETMLGDSAVAVHPDDERYKAMVGKTIMLPLANREIPIIADDYVDPDFGSGCVKITPAHDFNDYAMGQRHQLPQINILTNDAKLNDSVPAAYQGMDRFTARKQIVADLDAAGFLEKIADHKLMVPRGDRTGSVIEPYLTDQWFVDLTNESADGGNTKIIQPALDAVRNGDIKFVPQNWQNTYFQWLDNIQDWCISRQIWWGHRIPAWYDDAGNAYVANTEAAAREKYQLAADLPLRQDDDVLDTWFSSALWPFSTLGWPTNTEELATFYPTNVLVTGFDIIFFWVARMVMFGLYFTDKVPFKEVYIHGLVRDSEGQKMSKSKGNVLDPIDLIDGITLDALVAKRTSNMMQPQMAAKIEKSTRKQFPDGIPAYGCDALRFTFAAMATTGRDIKFDLGRIDGYRNFCNKLWNATRFVMMNLEGHEATLTDEDDAELSLADRWIISRLQHTEAEIANHFDTYRLDLAAKVMYEFVWHDYCDWYLELSKCVLNSEPTAAQARGSRRTLVRVLEAALRLLHPMMPFITEEIWQSLKSLAGKSGDTLMLAPYPQADDSKVDTDAEKDIAWVQAFILGLRQIRGEMDIAPSKTLPVLVDGANEEDQRRIAEHRVYLDKLGKVESLEYLADAAPQSATALVGEMKLLVPMAGLIDVAAEMARLTKQLDKEQAQLARVQGKLNNSKFTDKAPENVIAKERQKAEESQRMVTQLNEQIEQLKTMA